MYVYLKDNVAYELIPEIAPDFPNVPIEERYPAAFLAACVQTEDEVRQGYIYEDGRFHPQEREKEETEENGAGGD